MKIYQSKNGIFKQDITIDNINSFSWNLCLKEVREKCPVISSTLKALFPEANAVARQHFFGKGITQR